MTFANFADPPGSSAPENHPGKTTISDIQINFANRSNEAVSSSGVFV